MSDETYCWLFVWLATTFGWFTRVVYEHAGLFPATALSAVGLGLFIAVLERRMGRNRKEKP